MINKNILKCIFSNLAKCYAAYKTFSVKETKKGYNKERQCIKREKKTPTIKNII